MSETQDFTDGEITRKLQDEKLEVIIENIKTGKQIKQEKDENIKESIQTGKSLKKIKQEKAEKEDKKEKPEKAKIKIEGNPSKIKPENGTIVMDFTPEMAEALISGILNSINMLMPDRFKEPTESNIKTLKTPTFQVVQRWMPQIDLLKYLPEIVLATSFAVVLKDMKVEKKEKKEVKNE